MATEKADIAVVEFDALDLDALKDCRRGEVLVDLRNMFLPSQARAAGSATPASGVRVRSYSGQAVEGKARCSSRIASLP